MNIKKIYFPVFFLSLIMTFISPYTLSANTPGIEFKTETYDFGEVNEGDTVAYAFEFRNTGNEKLVITDVHPTCGCTVAGEFTHEVLPGKTGKIPVEFHTSGYQGDLRKTIKVTTNVPDKKEIVLILQGKVFTALTISPKSIWLGQFRKSEKPITGIISIKNNTKTAFRILKIIPPNDRIKVTSTLIKENEEYQLEIRPVPPFTEGWVDEDIIIKTNHPLMETATIRYTYDVKADVSVSPEVIFIKNVPVKKAFKETIKVKNEDSKPASIDGVTIIGGTLEYKVEEIITGKVFNIVVEFPEGFTLDGKETWVISFQVKNPNGIFTYSVPIYLEGSLD